jgi:hypothetical protein
MPTTPRLRSRADTAPAPTIPRADFLVDDPAQVEALASAVRQEILDTVIGLRRCTVRELAEALGRPADGLYYHVRQLVAVGLLREVRGVDRGASDALLVAPTQGIARLVYDPPTAKRNRAIRQVAGALLRSAEADFAGALGTERVRTSGRRRNLNASRQRAWLDDAQLLEVNALLARVQTIFTQATRPAGGALHSLTFVLAPLEPRPVRRAEAAASTIS